MQPTEFRDLRKSLGLTQRALSRRLGIGLNRVTVIEHGTGPVPVRYEFAIRWLALTEAEKRVREIKSELVA